MAYTQQQLDDLRAAIAQGALWIRSLDGQEVRFRSLAEMRQIEADMAAQLEPSQGRVKRTVLTYGGFS